jgi:hypothetical protein
MNCSKQYQTHSYQDAKKMEATAPNSATITQLIVGAPRRRERRFLKLKCDSNSQIVPKLRVLILAQM